MSNTEVRHNAEVLAAAARRAAIGVCEALTTAAKHPVEDLVVPSGESAENPRKPVA